MGVMPTDRERRWHEIFRRFGIPTDKPTKTETDADEAKNLPGAGDAVIPDVLLPDAGSNKKPPRG